MRVIALVAVRWSLFLFGVLVRRSLFAARCYCYVFPFVVRVLCSCYCAVFLVVFLVIAIVRDMCSCYYSCP